MGGGVSTFYFTAGGAGMAAAVRQFFNALKAWIPSDTGVSVQNVGDVLSDSTGAVVGSWSEATQSVVQGTAGLNYVSGVGARLVWNTGARRHNRLSRGSTFLVPVNEQAFANGGFLSATFISEAVAAGTALIGTSGNEPLVWSRPASGGSDGASHVVTSCSMTSTPSWLHTRKT